MHILDVGSHSLKLYSAHSEVRHLRTVTWELLENGLIPKTSILSILHGIDGPIRAIGTEAMRRNRAVATQIESLLQSLGVNFRVISQQQEANLIKNIFPQSDLAIVNIGGGSIQIIEERSQVLIPFGISDLNQTFLLNSDTEADIGGCDEYLTRKLPKLNSSFIYTGGEKTYLEKMKVPIKDLKCKLSDFSAMHNKICNMSLKQRVEQSPFDPNWMKGAIASNLCVLTLLKKANVNFFVPSDVNISNGLLEELRERS